MTETAHQSSSSSASGGAPSERPLSEPEAAARLESWTERAGAIARTTAEKVPAAVVVVAGGAVLLVTDAFGIGEVLTAGVAGYAAYRLLRRQARKRKERAAQTAASAARAE